MSEEIQGESKQQERMTDEQIVASWDSTTCSSCGHPKKRLDAFCLSCTLALTLWVRNWLSRGPSDSFFLQNFRSALAHLRLNAHRMKRVNGWSFTTKDEILDAGYEFKSLCHCRAVGCNERIAWFVSPVGKFVAVNISDCQMHQVSCKNPGVFRDRSVKTSARNRRRAR